MTQAPPVSSASLREFIVAQIENSPKPLTLKSLVHRTVLSAGFSSREIRSAVRDLVDRRALAYVQRLGHTFIEVSFEKPVRVSRRVIVTPPRMHHPGSGEDIVIVLQGGISFGSGSHPTTRLCLRALDDHFSDAGAKNRMTKGRLLDIGTGTGVLLVAGIRLGCRHAIGIDIDACALAEAGENLRINGVDRHAEVSCTPIDQLTGSFELITANLRPPTLRQMAPIISRLSMPGSALVLSGFREQEASRLIRCFEALNWQVYTRAEEKEWASVTMFREARMLRDENKKGTR
jgi:ribosomal protein L11 methyltransferase